MRLSPEAYADRTRAVGVYGLGFVGLHLALRLSRAYRVIAADPLAPRAEDLALGRDLFGAVAAEGLKASGIVFAGTPEALRECGLIVVVAPAGPDAPASPATLRLAAARVGACMAAGTTVVFESALPATKVARVCAPALAQASGLQEGVGFRVGVVRGGIDSKERVYKIADPIRHVWGDSPAVGVFLREVFEPCRDTLAVPTSAMLGVAVKDTPPPVSWREGVIASFAGVSLVATPWWLGGQDLAAQWFALAGALGAFVAVFLPGKGEARTRHVAGMMRAVVGSVPFLAGLALLTLFLCQGLNPAVSVEFSDQTWQLVQENPVRWLPAGVAAPFSLDRWPGGMNAFRTMLIFASPWLLFLALHHGVRSRRIADGLCLTLIFSSVIMAIYAVGDRVSGRLAGTPAEMAATPLGPFLYQNQGGAYFCLMFSLACGFGLRAWSRAKRGRGGPHWIAPAAACMLIVAVFASRSFGALLTLTVSVFAVIPAALTVRAKLAASRPVLSSVLPPALALGSLFSLMAAAVVSRGDFAGMMEKVRAKLELARAASLDDRHALREATWKMYSDHSPWFGSGAGSYRWSILDYLASAFGASERGVVVHTGYAHNDWLQILAEWGALGAAAVAAFGAWWLVGVLRGGRASWEVVLPLAAGVGMFLLHAFADYLIFNPGLALTVAFLLFYTLHAAQKKPA